MMKIPKLDEIGAEIFRKTVKIIGLQENKRRIGDLQINYQIWKLYIIGKPIARRTMSLCVT